MMPGVTAKADTITFDNYIKYAGGPPSPTFAATIEDIAGGVQITMENLVGTDAMKIFSWYFNLVSPIPTGLEASDVEFVGGVEATEKGATPGILLAEGIKKAGSGGKYDLVFTWSNSGSGQFSPGNSSIYIIPGVRAIDFLTLSTPSGGHGPYYSVVEQSAWWGQGSEPIRTTGDIGSTANQNVPEPTSLILLGTGLGVLGLGSWRRRTWLLNPIFLFLAFLIYWKASSTDWCRIGGNHHPSMDYIRDISSTYFLGVVLNQFK